MATFRGEPACACLIAWLPEYEKALLRAGVIRKNIDIYQLIGGAAASGGTHSRGGAFDIAQTQAEAIKIARQMGADATWHRRKNWDGRGGMAHTHGVLRGCPHNTPARYQIAAVDAGYNGLGYLGRAKKDDGPRPLSKRTWQQGIAWVKAQAKPAVFNVRVLQFNLPGADKLPNLDARLTRAADTINAAKVDVVFLNELESRLGPGKPSKTAASLLAKVGSKGWELVVPESDWNENYMLLRRKTMANAAQAIDVAIYGKLNGETLPGRHVTRVVGRHLPTGRLVGLACTQLVNDNREGAAVQATLAAAAAKELSTSNKGCPRILGGDLNMSDDPAGFVADGLINTRTHAKTTSVPDSATYTNYSKDRPSMNANWRIDHIWCTPGTVNHYGHLTDTYNGGVFRQPRPSDHVPVIANITFK